MALWEYKVITSGVHGFATPALLETYLNNLGKDEWEIVNYQPQPTNPLAFTGVVRRSTQRDWTPPIPVSVPAPATHNAPTHAEPLEQTHASGSQADETGAPAAPASAIPADNAPPVSAAESMRPVRNTDRDLDPDADDDSDADDEWNNLGIDEDLPTFFDALKPHMRNNQRGPGQSVAVEYLVKRWELPEADIVGALKECSLAIPETEDAEPQYFEFEDDLYWVNRNNRGQLFINTREKPRPKFRIATAKPLSPDDPAYAELASERADEQARIEKRNAERAAADEARKQKTEAREQQNAEAKNQKTEESTSRPASAETTESTATDTQATTSTYVAAVKVEPTPAIKMLLDRIRPLMRRNRHGPGYSGSISFLARALKMNDADLSAEIATLGLIIPATPGAKNPPVEIDNVTYWLNKDNRGNIWINGRENKNGLKPASGQTTPSSAPAAVHEDAARPTEQLELPAVAPAETRTNDKSKTPREQPAVSREKSESPNSKSDSESSDDTSSSLAAVRLLLKPNKRGTGVSGEAGYLSRTLGKSETEFIATLTAAGLVVPSDAEAKPVFVEHAGEIFWFGLFEKNGEKTIWLNAKVSKTPKKPATRTKKTKKKE